VHADLAAFLHLLLAAAHLAVADVVGAYDAADGERDVDRVGAERRRERERLAVDEDAEQVRRGQRAQAARDVSRRPRACR
jgi:hypothetical protein